jgi:L-fuculose-phosphate aldolase
MNEQQLHHEERKSIREYGVRLLEEDLTTETGGNLSIRIDDDRVAISPSEIPSESIAVWDVPVVTLDGSIVTGDCDPSDELPMHLEIYRRRTDVNAIVHTHSPYATAFATLNEPIPASHYLVACTGPEIPVAPYELYGTPELGAKAADTLGEEFNATLLKNHGVLAVDSSMSSAFEIAQMVEYCARIHHYATDIGDPSILSEDQIMAVRDKISDDDTNG